MLQVSRSMQVIMCFDAFLFFLQKVYPNQARVPMLIFIYFYCIQTSRFGIFFERPNEQIVIQWLHAVGSSYISIPQMLPNVTDCKRTQWPCHYY